MDPSPSPQALAPLSALIGYQCGLPDTLEAVLALSAHGFDTLAQAARDVEATLAAFARMGKGAPTRWRWHPVTSLEIPGATAWRDRRNGREEWLDHKRRIVFVRVNGAIERWNGENTISIHTLAGGTLEPLARLWAAGFELLTDGDEARVGYLLRQPGNPGP